MQFFLWWNFVSDCVEQEIIQDNQFPLEILLHLASMFIIILLFKSYHAFQKFLAVKVADVISVADLYADSFCKVRFSGIRFSENTEIVASFNKVKRGKHLCYTSRRILSLVRVYTVWQFFRWALSRITVVWALSFQPSVLPWRHAISFLESPVKVRKVVKTTLSGDRKDRIVGCTQTVSSYI